uniref:Uncharacterized protein n=1 Tax=Corethron hystrix TaxID=216773 RepID=A0A6U5H763_9STRA|mmetsp:Transcript_29229/g.67082  ORF Transcript_29229/g.67082 Transcript_29229/m.67082 type:complete len:299 (+) Transcript_29229:107-1003(+)
MNCSEEDIRKPNRILWLWGTASVIFCVPVILLSGLSRSWNTSLEHPRRFRFGTVENPSRFWPEPNQYPGNEDASIPGRDHPSSSSNWYYWKLRPSDTDDVCDADGTEPWNLSCSVRRAGRTSRAAVWTLYVLHQTSMWALIYAAQRSAPSDRGAAYSNNLRWYNVAALGITALAHAAHLAQTHATYDGLAQDVAESSSQASVIVLLVFVLTMETGRRGLILGWPSRRRGKAEAAVQPEMEEGEAATIDSPQNCCCYPVADGPIELLRKYHGYFIVWATVYTFWYHPMEVSYQSNSFPT